MPVMPNDPTPAPKDAPPGHPVGQSLGWTDDDLDDLSDVTPADVDAAAETFRRVAPRSVRRLLDE
jgi:hypothetical protein